MQQTIRKAADDTDHTIEREFLGDITAAELIEQIIRSHLFPASEHAAPLSQPENVSQGCRLNENGSFL